MTVRVAVAGATGKLGSVAVRLIEAADDLELVAALDSRSPLDAMLGADVLVDMTLPQVSQRIVHFAVDRAVLAGDGLPDARRVAPLARLGRSEWSTLGRVISLDRIRYADWQDGRRSADS